MIEENSQIEYILEIDLECPDELHELHNNYPLAPEKLEISHNMLSTYFSFIANKYGIKNGGINKLVLNLDIKSKYVLRYRNLQFYLLLGMKLVSVHRVLKFKQYDWLIKYIDFYQAKEKILPIVLKKTFLN